MSNSDDYKELAGEINVLRNDVARSAHASKFTASANKSAIDENKSELKEVERRLRELEGKLPTYELRLSQVEGTTKEHTGKIRTAEIEEAKDEKGVALAQNKTELKGKQLALYGSIAVAVITGIVNLLLHFFGG